MTLYTRDNLQSLLEDLEKHLSPVFLIIGDRFLCQQVCEKISSALLKNGGSVHSIDGDQEDFSTTLNKFRSFSIWPGRQLYKISDTKLFHSKNIAGSLWKKGANAFKEGKHEKAASYIGAMLEIGGMKPDESDNDLASLAKSTWKKLFGFTMPSEDIGWTRQLPFPKNDKKQSGASSTDDDIAAFLEQVLETGAPEKNFLILLAEEVDKRKRLFKYFKDKQTIIDLTVDTGNTAGAKKAQRSVLLELIRDTASRYHKTLPVPLADTLIERVGYSPVAIVLETEKLCLYTGDAGTVRPEDLNAVIGRTRQEALFELTGAVSERNLEKSLVIASRLRENGIHGLVILASLRNHIRSLLICRVLQEQSRYGYNQNMQPARFQSHVIPLLKENTEWQKEVSIHPYALYIQFKTAAAFPLERLRHWLTILLDAEMQLKGSPYTPALIIENLLISMLANTNDAGLQKKDWTLH